MGFADSFAKGMEIGQKIKQNRIINEIGSFAQKVLELPEDQRKMWYGDLYDKLPDEAKPGISPTYTNEQDIKKYLAGATARRLYNEATKQEVEQNYKKSLTNLNNVNADCRLHPEKCNLGSTSQTKLENLKFRHRLALRNVDYWNKHRDDIYKVVGDITKSQQTWLKQNESSINKMTGTTFTYDEISKNYVEPLIGSLAVIYASNSPFGADPTRVRTFTTSTMKELLPYYIAWEESGRPGNIENIKGWDTLGAQLDDNQKKILQLVADLNKTSFGLFDKRSKKKKKKNIQSRVTNNNQPEVVGVTRKTQTIRKGGKIINPKQQQGGNLTTPENKNTTSVGTYINGFRGQK